MAARDPSISLRWSRFVLALLGALLLLLSLPQGGGEDLSEQLDREELELEVEAEQSDLEDEPQPSVDGPPSALASRPVASPPPPRAARRQPPPLAIAQAPRGPPVDAANMPRGPPSVRG